MLKNDIEELDVGGRVGGLVLSWLLGLSWGCCL